MAHELVRKEQGEGRGRRKLGGEGKGREGEEGEGEAKSAFVLDHRSRAEPSLERSSRRKGKPSQPQLTAHKT